MDFRRHRYNAEGSCEEIQRRAAKESYAEVIGKVALFVANVCDPVRRPYFFVRVVDLLEISWK